MKAELVLSGRKEALKHIGRANESTLAKLKKLLVEDESEESMNVGNVNSESSEPQNNIEDPEEPKPDMIETALNEALNVADKNSITPESSFVSSLEEHFLMLKEKVSMFSPRFSVEQLLATSTQYSPALVFTSLQVLFIRKLICKDTEMDTIKPIIDKCVPINQ